MYSLMTYFLSFKVIDMVEQGLFPYDEKILCNIARDISYNNAINYFGIK